METCRNVDKKPHDNKLPRFLQATMELIDRGQYISWSLPKNWTIVLTSNPDNGDYNVNSLDNAQKTRYISFELDFDVDCWARWAEEEGIDSRGINFVLNYPEIMKKEGNVQTVNARSLVTFFNTISGFKDFGDVKTLALIMNIASGCFTSKENVIGKLFTTFIHNRLDKLVTPKELVEMDWKTLKDKLYTCLYSGGGEYRADIASILTTRFINYTNVLIEKGNADSKQLIERILDFVGRENEKHKYLSEDLIFNMIKTLSVKHPVRFRPLLANPKIISKLA